MSRVKILELESVRRFYQNPAKFASSLSFIFFLSFPLSLGIWQDIVNRSNWLSHDQALIRRVSKLLSEIVSVVSYISFFLCKSSITILLVWNHPDEIYTHNKNITAITRRTLSGLSSNCGCSIESKSRNTRVPRGLKSHFVERIIGFDGRTGHNTRFARDS